MELFPTDWVPTKITLNAFTLIAWLDAYYSIFWFDVKEQNELLIMKADCFLGLR